MKRKYIFCHGFGYSSKFWQNLKPYFNINDSIFLDLGYFNQPSVELNFDINEFELIGIGHSLGLINLLQLKVPFKYLIGLNSFVNFLGYDSLIRKKRYIELKALKHSFMNNPIETLNTFYIRCGINTWQSEYESINKELLLQALEMLEKEFNIPAHIETCVISTENDIIVPIKLVKDNFNDKCNIKQIFLKEGLHSLGFNYAYIIKELIDNFLNDKV